MTEKTWNISELNLTDREVELHEEYDLVDVFDYLDDLRDSGKTNMCAAGSYIQQEFGSNKRESCELLQTWMKYY